MLFFVKRKVGKQIRQKGIAEAKICPANNGACKASASLSGSLEISTTSSSMAWTDEIKKMRERKVRERRKVLWDMEILLTIYSFLPSKKMIVCLDI